MSFDTFQPLSIERHAAVQRIAKIVLAELNPLPSDTEDTIAARARRLLAKRGVWQTWYHDCHALVLLGSRSCLSISGGDYQPADEPVGRTNVVTVDLSPLLDGAWGDCARTFVIENGVHPAHPYTAEFEQGLSAQQQLHAAMRRFVRPETTLGELHTFGNRLITGMGFENLDYCGNLGHSIEASADQRRYVEEGNGLTLGEAGVFTFEPHIRANGGVWGYKHEDIYWFDAQGALQVL